MPSRFFRSLAVALATTFFVSGCAVVQVKPQGRVASDQLLTALAIEDAVANLQLREQVENRNVKLTVAHVGTIEENLDYARAAVRARILQEGGRIAKTGQAAPELVVMIQTVGSDIDQSSVALPIPLPAVGSVSVTELAFYTDSKQIARCRMWVYLVDQHGSLAFVHPPVHVAHRVKNPTLMGVTLGKFSDVKELDHSKGNIPIKNPGLTK